MSDINFYPILFRVLQYETVLNLISHCPYIYAFRCRFLLIYVKHPPEDTLLINALILCTWFFLSAKFRQSVDCFIYCSIYKGMDMILWC